MDFTGKTAIVTGAGAGIDRETALLLARGDVADPCTAQP